MKVPVYSLKSKSSLTLPKGFAEEDNLVLLAQAVHVYQDRGHIGKAKAKTRGEVALTKRKIYSQKGTGNARHHAKSAPIFVGGGKAHGPKGVKRVLTLPKKMRVKALSTALNLKASNGKLIALDKVSLLKKTKDANALVEKTLKGEKIKKETKVTVFLAPSNEKKYMLFKNINNVSIAPFRNINAFRAHTGGVLLFDKEAFNKK